MKKKNPNLTVVLFKAKHTQGVKYVGSVCEYIGESRLDGLPIYSYTHSEYDTVNWNLIFKDFIFNCKPRYTPTSVDFERIKDLRDWDSWANNLVPVQLMSEPNSTLFYLDFVYSDQDERLLLMM